MNTKDDIPESSNGITPNYVRVGNTLYHPTYTPKTGVTWYLKWFGTVITITGLTCRSMDIFVPYDLLLSLTGTISWLFVGILWNDRSLIVFNTVCSTILLSGVIRALTWGEIGI